MVVYRVVVVLRGRRRFSTSPSNLYTKYSFSPPTSLSPSPSTETDEKPSPNSTTQAPHTKKKMNLPPFDFRFSYTESSPSVRPIGLREPKYSPFGPHTIHRPWTGVCAPAADDDDDDDDDVVDDAVNDAADDDDDAVDDAVDDAAAAAAAVDDAAAAAAAVHPPSPMLNTQLEAKRKIMRDRIQGHQLTNAETLALLNTCHRHKTKRQINLGRDGLTHNMLNDIHNNWKHAEAVRIKCMGVPTVDMKNVCMQLEDKAFGKIIHRHGGSLILYRGRNYNPKKRPVIPLMLWKPQEPIYPKLIKTTIEGLSIQETKQMRKKGLAVPALTKLAKNGYYGGLVPMIRDAFLVEELVRIDCQGLEKKDYKKLGSKLRDLVPCILVTFEKEQIVVWRGKDYKPREGGCFLTDRESFDKSDTNPGQETQDVNHGQIEFDSEDED